MAWPLQRCSLFSSRLLAVITTQSKARAVLLYRQSVSQLSRRASAGWKDSRLTWRGSVDHNRKGRLPYNAA